MQTKNLLLCATIMSHYYATFAHGWLAWAHMAHVGVCVDA